MHLIDFYNNFYSKQRTIIGAYLNHLIIRCIIILLIVTDIIIVITSVSLPGIKLNLFQRVIDFFNLKLMRKLNLLIFCKHSIDIE